MIEDAEALQIDLTMLEGAALMAQFQRGQSAAVMREHAAPELLLFEGAVDGSSAGASPQTDTTRPARPGIDSRSKEE